MCVYVCTRIYGLAHACGYTCVFVCLSVCLFLCLCACVVKWLHVVFYSEINKSGLNTSDYSSD